MKPTMSMFASRADYDAALAADKSKVAAHYAAEEAKAAADEQQAKDAAMWRKLTAMHIFDVADIADECNSMDDFIDAINEQ